MSLIDIKNDLVKKTITNLQADVTRKGTWAYQNSLALESLMSSDNMLNDLVDYSKSVREDIKSVKDSVKVDYSFKTLKREIPNRFSESVIVKEIEGELISWSQNKENFQVLVSKDNGYSWETILNISFGIEDGSFEIPVFDIMKIDGKYFVSFTSNFDGFNKLYLAEIIGGEVKSIDIVKTLDAGNSIVGIKIFKDKYLRPTILISENNNSYEDVQLCVKNSLGNYVVQSLNFEKSSAVFGQDILVDDKGIVYITLNQGGKLGFLSCDLSDESYEIIPVEYFVSSLNEETVDVNSLTTFVYGEKIYAVRVGGKIQSFDTKLKFIDIFSNLILTSDSKIYPFLITENLEIIFKNKISKDLGKTWEVLNISEVPIQQSLSNLSKYGSFYKNFTIYQNEADVNKLNSKKYITTIEEIKDTKIYL